MAYEGNCAACTYMGEDSDYEGKYWCSVKGEDRYACDSKCNSFCEAYARSDYSRSNMIENSRGHMGSGCYLTTIMCKILGYPDNNYYLNTLRNFRDNVMKKNPKYIPMLLTYDMVGPIISYNLSIDKDRLNIASTLFSTYIVKACDAIEDEKYEVAISIYMAMTTELGRKYNANIELIAPHFDEIDMATLGHGRSKVYSR